MNSGIFSIRAHVSTAIREKEKKWGKAKKIDCENSMLKSRDRIGIDKENDCHLYWRKVTLDMDSKHQHLKVELCRGAGDNDYGILFI